MRQLVIVFCLGLLAACARKDEGPVAPVVAPETAREIAQGALVGFVSEDGAHVWRGLPFAASTGGENRWRAPRPASGWEGTREALEFSERCPQMTNRYDEAEGLEPGQLIGSEDCLTLNIYAPADAAGKDLPVMLWIHGGGNVWGRAASYDGSRLAVNEDVIIVTVQYRLGPLGFFAHEVLRESAEVPADAAANFATLDLIASLEWVRDNISAFGGNPENVTIFGESAGGHNVVTLLASTLAEGLFHRAIIQSGSFDSWSMEEASGANIEVSHPNASGFVTANLGVSSAEELRNVALKDLFDAHWNATGGFIDVPTVIQDGVVLPETRLREAFSSTDTFNAVPIITGTNRDEMKLFYLADPRLAKRKFGIFFVAKDQDLYDAASDYASRVWRVRAVDWPADMMAEAGHDQVYAYRFDWDDGGRFLFMDLKKMLGAAHAMEIPFVFNRFQLLGDADRIMFQKKTFAERDALSRAMGAYWASFAKDGVPAGNPDWPAYTSEGFATLIRFDTESDGGIEIIKGKDNLGLILLDLKADPRLDEEQTCLIGASIAEWVPELYEEVLEELGCDG